MNGVWIDLARLAASGAAILAVAGLARWLGLGAHILVPADMVDARREAIASEGARVTVVDGSYDEAVEAAARRQKWLDQAQSLNLYVSRPDGRALDALYQLAWERGLKTTYYLRSQAATRVEKSTLAVSDGKLNAVAPNVVDAPACSVDDPDCEACQ